MHCSGFSDLSAARNFAPAERDCRHEPFDVVIGSRNPYPRASDNPSRKTLRPQEGGMNFGIACGIKISVLGGAMGKEGEATAFALAFPSERHSRIDLTFAVGGVASEIIIARQRFYRDQFLCPLVIVNC